LPAADAFHQLRETLKVEKERADWTAFLADAELPSARVTPSIVMRAKVSK
jgi:hypothetical protein